MRHCCIRCLAPRTAKINIKTVDVISSALVLLASGLERFAATRREKMTLVRGIFVSILAVTVSGLGAWAQQTPAEQRQARQEIMQNPKAENIRTYYLKSASQASEANEWYTALRNMLPADIKSYLVPSQNA